MPDTRLLAPRWRLGAADGTEQPGQALPRRALDQGPQAELDDRGLAGSAGGSQGIREQDLIDVERRSHAYDVGAIVCIRQGAAGWWPAVELVRVRAGVEP